MGGILWFTVVLLNKKTHVELQKKDTVKTTFLQKHGAQPAAYCSFGEPGATW